LTFWYWSAREKSCCSQGYTLREELLQSIPENVVEKTYMPKMDEHRKASVSQEHILKEKSLQSIPKILLRKVNIGHKGNRNHCTVYR
jgi:hypothetical protein